MKYVNTGVVFQEIPDEVTLSINISNCPCHCIGCHSEYLWEDIGEVLSVVSLGEMLRRYADDITCVCFMGGDASPAEVDALAVFVKREYPQLKIAWYSGRSEISTDVDVKHFDFLKIGPYVETLGGLASRTTNQRMYRVGDNGSLTDITSRFWKKS